MTALAADRARNCQHSPRSINSHTFLKLPLIKRNVIVHVVHERASTASPPSPSTTRSFSTLSTDACKHGIQNGRDFKHGVQNISVTMLISTLWLLSALAVAHQSTIIPSSSFHLSFPASLSKLSTYPLEQRCLRLSLFDRFRLLSHRTIFNSFD